MTNQPPRRTLAEQFQSHLQTRGHLVRVIRRFGQPGQTQFSTVALRGTTVDHRPYYAFPPETDPQPGDVVTRRELLDTRWRIIRVEEVREEGRLVQKKAYLDMIPPAG